MKTVAKTTTNAAEVQAFLEMKAQIEALRAENEALRVAKIKAESHGTGGFKVSVKGGISVYGLGKFPVTLYKEQWEKLMSQDKREKLAAFMELAGPYLATKESSKVYTVEQQAEINAKLGELFAKLQ